MPNQRIEIDPGIHFGQPCVAGTRIPVSDVLEVVGRGIPFKQIVHDYYLDLTVENIEPCIHHAAQVLRSEDAHAGG